MGGEIIFDKEESTSLVGEKRKKKNKEEDEEEDEDSDDENGEIIASLNALMGNSGLIYPSDNQFFDGTLFNYDKDVMKQFGLNEKNIKRLKKRKLAAVKRSKRTSKKSSSKPSRRKNLKVIPKSSLNKTNRNSKRKIS